MPEQRMGVFVTCSPLPRPRIRREWASGMGSVVGSLVGRLFGDCVCAIRMPHRRYGSAGPGVTRTPRSTTHCRGSGMGLALGEA